MNNNFQTTNDIDQAFNDCLDMVKSGASLEDCLSLYPQYADQLPSMLATVNLVHNAYNEIKPLPVSKARIKVAVMQAVYPQKTVGSFFRNMFRTPAVVFLIATLLIFIVGGGALTAISQNTMPGNALYGIKRTSENIEMFLNFTDDGKANQSYKMAERRAKELVYALSQKDAKAATNALNDFKKYYYIYTSYSDNVKPQKLDLRNYRPVLTTNIDSDIGLHLNQALAVVNVYLYSSNYYDMIDNAAFRIIADELIIILEY